MPKNSFKWYVRIIDGQRSAVRIVKMPTSAVLIGPFRTQRAAFWAAANPYGWQTVAEAEDKARPMPNSLFGVDGGHGYQDVSRTEKGAKRYATAHGYRDVYRRDNSGYGLEHVATKRGAQWVKP